MLGLLAFCLLVASATWAQSPALRRGLGALVVLDLTRRLCVVPGAEERAASWAAGVAPPAFAGLERWQWAGGWAATLAWYVVTAWIVVVCLKNEGPALCQEPGLRGGSERNCANPTLGSIPKAALVAPALAVVALYLAYPWLRGWRIEYVAVAAYAIGLGVQLAAGTRASLRWEVPPAADRAAWLTGWILVVSTISSAAGAWALAHPIRDWYATRWLAVLTWAAVGGVHLWALVRRTE